jgi:pyruvate formate lyase activating enzyme
MEAKLYQKLENESIKCFLCPHECIIQSGKRGICRVRSNVKGILMAESFQLYSAIHFDPIEKKPLYHFYPGREILSVGSVGCNLRCEWCQNCDISQNGINDGKGLVTISPERLCEMALDYANNIGIAYTYNEPSISYESIILTADLFKEKGLKNIMVTNGYFGIQAREEYIQLMDAFNVDVKAFSDIILKKYTGSTLQPVLDTIKKAKIAGKHVELTYLVIPEINDDEKQFSDFIRWILNETGKETVLHISKYFPRFKMIKPPTQTEKLNLLAQFAGENLDFVYLGNTNSDEYCHTKCPKCNLTLLTRAGYRTEKNRDCKQGVCPNCKTKIFVDD